MLLCFSLALESESSESDNERGKEDLTEELPERKRKADVEDRPSKSLAAASTGGIAKVAATSAAAAAAPKPVEKRNVTGSLDKAIAALKGGKKPNLLQQSRAKWDSFKEKEGIADELKQAARNGFVFGSCSGDLHSLMLVDFWRSVRS
mgnify:CR=1 FL=1